MGYRIKELRESANMTQSDLAEKSGVSRVIINGLESGRVKATSTKSLQKLAKALNTQVQNIFFDA